MAWTLSGTASDLLGAHTVVLSEEATGVGTKTLVWPTDIAALFEGEEGRVLEVLGVRVELATTATVGDRRPIVRALDGSDDVLFESPALNTIPANTANGVYEFGAGWGPVSAAIELIAASGVARCSLPMGLLVSPSHKLVVTQQAVFDAADTCIVHVRGRLRLKVSALHG